jgi:hypothetical protein
LRLSRPEAEGPAGIIIDPKVIDYMNLLRVGMSVKRNEDGDVKRDEDGDESVDKVHVLDPMTDIPDDVDIVEDAVLGIAPLVTLLEQTPPLEHVIVRIKTGGSWDFDLSESRAEELAFIESTTSKSTSTYIYGPNRAGLTDDIINGCLKQMPHLKDAEDAFGDNGVVLLGKHGYKILKNAFNHNYLESVIAHDAINQNTVGGRTYVKNVAHLDIVAVFDDFLKQTDSDDLKKMVVSKKEAIAAFLVDFDQAVTNYVKPRSNPKNKASPENKASPTKRNKTPYVKDDDIIEGQDASKLRVRDVTEDRMLRLVYGSPGAIPTDLKQMMSDKWKVRPSGRAKRSFFPRPSNPAPPSTPLPFPLPRPPFTPSRSSPTPRRLPATRSTTTPTSTLSPSGSRASSSPRKTTSSGSGTSSSRPPPSSGSSANSTRSRHTTPASSTTPGS